MERKGAEELILKCWVECYYNFHLSPILHSILTSVSNVGLPSFESPRPVSVFGANSWNALCFAKFGNFVDESELTKVVGI